MTTLSIFSFLGLGEQRLAKGSIGQFGWYFKEVSSMCDCGCTNPEKKVKDPAKCSPEQVAECHPKSKGHRCAE